MDETTQVAQFEPYSGKTFIWLIVVPIALVLLITGLEFGLVLFMQFAG